MNIKRHFIASVNEALADSPLHASIMWAEHLECYVVQYKLPPMGSHEDFALNTDADTVHEKMSVEVLLDVVAQTVADVRFAIGFIMIPEIKK